MYRVSPKTKEKKNQMYPHLCHIAVPNIYISKRKHIIKFANNVSRNTCRRIRTDVKFITKKVKRHVDTQFTGAWQIQKAVVQVFKQEMITGTQTNEHKYFEIWLPEFSCAPDIKTSLMLLNPGTLQQPRKDPVRWL